MSRKIKRVIMSSTLENLTSKIIKEALHEWVPGIPKYCEGTYYVYIEKTYAEDYMVGYANRGNTRVPQLKTCQCCGIDFEAKNSRKMFCSKKCRIQYHNNQQSLQRNQLWG